MPGPKTKGIIRAKVYERDGHRCLKCGTPEDLTLDHILAISKGGKWTVKNLQTLCEKCNNEKGVEFIDYRKSKKKAQKPQKILTQEMEEFQYYRSQITGVARQVDLQVDYCAELWNHISRNGLEYFSYNDLLRYFENYVLVALHKMDKQPYVPTLPAIREPVKKKQDETLSEVTPLKQKIPYKASESVKRFMKSHQVKNGHVDL
jgi:hypothetical protein